jgi:hypothetical protein
MLDNRKRIYALASWTVECRARGWYMRRTDHEEVWRGPYSSEVVMEPPPLCRRGTGGIPIIFL